MVLNIKTNQATNCLKGPQDVFECQEKENNKGIHQGVFKGQEKEKNKGIQKDKAKAKKKLDSLTLS